MRAIVAPAWNAQAMHRHADARLIVFLGGEMEEESFEGRGRFRRGDFVFRPAWYAHADRAGALGAAYVRLPVTGGAVRRWLALQGWRAARGWIDLDRMPHGDDALSEASAAPYRPPAEHSHLQRAAGMLAGETQPKIAEVAQQLGLQAYELSRRFKPVYGISPAAYRRQARLQRALRLLFEGGESLSRIASDAGYHDQSHFTTELRRETGRTPGALAAELAG